MAMVSLGLTLLGGWVWAEYQKSEGLSSLQSETDRSGILLKVLD